MSKPRFWYVFENFKILEGFSAFYPPLNITKVPHTFDTWLYIQIYTYYVYVCVVFLLEKCQIFVQWHFVKCENDNIFAEKTCLRSICVLIIIIIKCCDNLQSAVP